MDIKRIHHVAYRCRDAKETVEFYQLGEVVEGKNAYLSLMQGAVTTFKTCFQ